MLHLSETPGVAHACQRVKEKNAGLLVMTSEVVRNELNYVISDLEDL